MPPALTPSNATATAEDELIRQVRTRFEREFDRPPAVTAVAPGRVNLIGDHVDYCDGIVLPLAIERVTVVAAGWNDVRPPALRAVSATFDERRTLALPLHKPPQGDWTAYLAGVFDGWSQETGSSAALERGIDLAIASSIPPGGGLASSAALNVAVLSAIDGLAGSQRPISASVRLCLHAEHAFAGVPCGLMDPYAVLAARRNHLVRLDCQTEQIERIPFDDPSLTILVCDSGVRHRLAGSEYAVRRHECQQAAAQLGVTSLRQSVAAAREPLENLPGPLRSRARHVVSEIERVERAADAAREADGLALGRLMSESHCSLRDDFQVSCRELDELVAALQRLPGVLGARMTGGGFGGYAVALAARESLPSIAQRLATLRLAAQPHPVAWFATRPAEGARRG